MDPWLDRFADALHLERLDPVEAEALLDLARVVAHGTERRNAPLATYLAGRWAAGGGDATRAVQVATELLGPGPG